MKAKKHTPIHPGEALKDVLDSAELSPREVAAGLRIPAGRLADIIRGKRAINAETAMRLARYFGTSAQMWMNLQSAYELQLAEDAAADRIAKEVQPFKKAS
jgi:antitoxin HigA-1